MAPFKLVKWYLDCVDPGGHVGIAYWAVVSWHGVTVPWQRGTVYAPHAAAHEPRTYTSLRATPPPAFEGDHLHWTASSAATDVEYDRLVSGQTIRLLDSRDGVIDWTCEAPVARARFAVGGGPVLRGYGYAERIEVTVPPWRLPIDELRWGRWIADDGSRSVVWINWRGAKRRTWVLVDGKLARVAEVSDDGVRTEAEELSLTHVRALHEESVNSVVNAVPGLAQLARRTGLAMRDHKWASRGTWGAPGESPTPGRAVHEIVWMR